MQDEHLLLVCTEPNMYRPHPNRSTIDYLVIGDDPPWIPHFFNGSLAFPHVEEAMRSIERFLDSESGSQRKQALFLFLAIFSSDATQHCPWWLRFARRMSGIKLTVYSSISSTYSRCFACLFLCYQQIQDRRIAFLRGVHRLRPCSSAVHQ